MYLKEALDDLYVCATNAKNATLEEGYYEKCYDRVIEELEKQDTEIKKLEQENQFLKMMYRGTEEFKSIEKLANSQEV